jgi:hypothetical protein
MAECVLCCAKIGRNTHSREHVFPDWLEQLFVPEGDSDTELVPYVRRFQRRGGTMEREEWEDIPFNMRVKDLCKPCNNQWCNGIETEAKPILLPLIAAQRKTLDASDQTSLAIWATKTLLMLQLTHKEKERSVHGESFRWFRAHRWPLPNEQIWVARYDGEGDWPVSYRHYGISMHEASRADPSAQVNAHCLAISIGHLVFLAFGHMIENGPRAEVTRGKPAVAALRPIWPALGNTVEFPPPGLLVGNAGLDAIVDAFGDADEFHGRDVGLDGLRFAPRSD